MKRALQVLVGAMCCLLVQSAYAQTAYPGDLITTGSNSWLLHSPDDGRSTLFLTPAANGQWDWGKSVHFLSNGSILTSGGLGVGTTSPYAKLSVLGGDGTGASPTISITNSPSNFAWSLISLRTSSDNNSEYVIGRGSNDFAEGRALTIHVPDRSWYGNTGSQPKIAFVSSGANVLGSVEAQTGNWYMKGKVGIGTANPEMSLDVRGPVIIESDNDGAVLFTGRGATELSRYLRLLNSQGHSSASGLMVGGVLVADNYGYARPGKNDLVVKGTVGIGTANTAGYALAVNGKIRTKEVKVESNWADFVFAPDYKLRSLEEVEAHIKEYGHLPDVPSAKEVQQDGIDLGKANTLLLQKIEELTLYMIEMKRENEALKRQNGEILKKLNERN